MLRAGIRVIRADLVPGTAAPPSSPAWWSRSPHGALLVTLALPRRDRRPVRPMFDARHHRPARPIVSGPRPPMPARAAAAARRRERRPGSLPLVEVPARPRARIHGHVVLEGLRARARRIDRPLCLTSGREPRRPGEVLVSRDLARPTPASRPARRSPLRGNGTRPLTVVGVGVVPIPEVRRGWVTPAQVQALAGAGRRGG